jgi:hypothetical protein
MTQPRHNVPNAQQRFRRCRRTAMIALLSSLFVAQSGCQNLSQWLREQERHSAIKTAHTQTQRGQCDEGLRSLDRAQAKLEIGRYARVASAARTRCYEILGLTEVARAHRRLIDDFYTREPMALPEADGSSIFRVSKLRSAGYERPPNWLGIPPPRYSPSARRSKIVGRVVIAFELTEDGRTKKIRVLEMPHPLLATWAIEAVSQAGKKKRSKGSQGNLLAMSGDVYVTTFVFYWRWAVEEEEDEYDEYYEEDEYDEEETEYVECEEDDPDERCEEY